MHLADVGDPGTTDEIAAALWGISGHLHHQVVEGRIPDVIPPPDLERRLNGGSNPRIARYYSDVLTDPPLPPGARILDMGCGYGRIALELATRLTPDQHYTGLDPHAEAVAWATANITPTHPNLTFRHLDIVSKAYNEGGVLLGPELRFPFEDASLDLIFMISVNTHVDAETVGTYIREAARTLKPGTGRFVSTFFLLDDEVELLLAEGRSTFTMSHPHGPSRVQNADNPELAIAHPRTLVLELLEAAGFPAPIVAEGNWSGRAGTEPEDYQDLVVAQLGAPPQRRDTAAAGPSASEHAVLLRAAHQLQQAGIGSTAELSALLDWSVPVVVNALWWAGRGWNLTPTGETDPIALVLTSCRALGFDAASPVESEIGTFVPLDDYSVLELVVRAGGRATRSAIIDCILEIVLGGRVLLDPLREGVVFELVSPEGRRRPAPLPSALPVGVVG